MLENFQGDSWGSIPPLRMPSLLPRDLCHGRSASRWLQAVIEFQLSYYRSSLNMQYAGSRQTPTQTMTGPKGPNKFAWAGAWMLTSGLMEASVRTLDWGIKTQDPTVHEPLVRREPLLGCSLLGTQPERCWRRQTSPVGRISSSHSLLITVCGLRDKRVMVTSWNTWLRNWRRGKGKSGKS